MAVLILFYSSPCLELLFLAVGVNAIYIRKGTCHTTRLAILFNAKKYCAIT